MASTIVLKRRIVSIRNTRQITKAMQLVSASKLKRAQEYAAKSRDYHDLAVEMIGRLSQMPDVEKQPLYSKRNIKSRLYIVVSSNTGLAGAFNANIFKILNNDLKENRDNGIKSSVIAIGNKGAQYVRRLRDVDLIAVYPIAEDYPDANDVRPILNSVIDGFKDGEFDEILVLKTLFKSSISQIAQSVTLLPATLDIPDKPQVKPITNFEPDIESVIDQVTIRLVEAQLFQAILESRASEHAMRMMAMKNATDNAKDLIDDYTLELNTVRQSSITQELAEISGGVEALAQNS